MKIRNQDINVDSDFDINSQNLTNVADAVSNDEAVNLGQMNTALGGKLESTDIDTLAELNAVVSDATLIDTADSRLSDARTPTAHTHDAADIDSGTLDGDRLPGLSATKVGGAPATGTPSGKFLKDDGTWDTPAGGGDLSVADIDTLAELNAIVSDATLIDTSDSRLSDARTPTAHTHVSTDITDFDGEVSNNVSVAANTAKITNATHTGDVTGSHALSIDKSAITGRTLVTGDGADHILIADDSDSDNLKKVLLSDLIGGSDPVVTEASSSSTITRTSTSYGLMTSMTITPASGNYMVWVSTSVSNNDTNGETWIAIYSGGSILSDSERAAKNADSKQKDSMRGLSTQGKVTVNGSQAIEVRWKQLNGGTATAIDRTLNIMKID